MFEEAERGKMSEVSRQRGAFRQKEPQGELPRAGGCTGRTGEAVKLKGAGFV